MVSGNYKMHDKNETFRKVALYFPLCS